MCMKSVHSTQGDGRLLKLSELHICLSLCSEIICSLFRAICFTSKKQCCMSNDFPHHFQIKELFQTHVSPLRCLCFLPRECNLSDEDEEKTRPSCGLPMCLCAWRVFFPLLLSLFLYFGELEHRLSAPLFPTNQVLPNLPAKAGHEAFQNTLLINKPPMPAFHFYSTGTSAIEIPEKKNDIIISPSGSLHCAHRLKRCVGCVVCMHVSRKGADKVLQAISPSFFSNLPVQTLARHPATIRQLKSMNSLPSTALMTVYKFPVEIKRCFWCHLGSCCKH